MRMMITFFVEQSKNRESMYVKLFMHTCTHIRICIRIYIYIYAFVIFKPGARRPCAWFLIITFIPPKYVCMGVSVTVCPQAHK